MENTKMYVITMATGSHDSSSEKVICITPDLKKGEDYVNQKNQAFSSMSEKLNKFHKNEYKEWKLNNPSPQNKVKLLDIPKWKSNQEITTEMREERKALELKNYELARNALEPVVQWHKQMDQFCLDWAKAQLTADEYEIYLINDDNYWYIEETSWL